MASDIDIVGTVPLDSPMVPPAGIHRYVVIGKIGEVLVIRRGNGQSHALTYRTRGGAQRAVSQLDGAGTVLDREAQDG